MGFLLFALDSTVVESGLWATAYNGGIILSYFETTCNFVVYYCCNNLFRAYFLSMFKKNRVADVGKSIITNKN